MMQLEIPHYFTVVKGKLLDPASFADIFSGSPQ